MIHFKGILYYFKDRVANISYEIRAQSTKNFCEEDFVFFILNVVIHLSAN